MFPYFCLNNVHAVDCVQWTCFALICHGHRGALFEFVIKENMKAQL